MRRLLLAAAAVAALAAVVAGAIVLLKPSLDRSEKWFSIAGVVLSTGLAVASTWLARRPGPRAAEPPATAGPEATPPRGQAVTGSVVGGDIVQVRGVRGSLRIGPAAAQPARRPPAPPGGSAGATGQDGQRVEGTWSNGPVRQVDDVGGDVELG